LKIVLELILINLFILNLAVGTISNYSGKIFLLKGLVSSLLIIAMIANFKMTNDKWQRMANNSGIKKLSVILFLFIGYLSLTLTYSSNPAYGFQKTLNFIISIVPSVIVFYYLISTFNELRLKLSLYSISAITIVSVIFIIINYPFEQSTIYHYKPGRWSHVIYGRMISSIAVVLLLYLMWVIEKGKAKEERRSVILLIIITSIAVYGTYLSALRAAFVGLMLVGGGLLLHSVWFLVRSAWLKQKDRYIITKNEKPAFRSGRLRTKKLSIAYSLLITIILSALLIFLVPKPNIINYRFDNMTAIDDLHFKGDPAIHSRLDYWQLSQEIIKDNPVIGVGMGGFSSYHKVEVYPHNIILEFAVEGGVIGLLIFILLIYIILSRTWKIYPNTILFFLFVLWLALFSKEFSNQSLLWIGLAFYGLTKAD